MLSFLKTDCKIILVWLWLVFCWPGFVWADSDAQTRPAGSMKEDARLHGQKQDIETRITEQKKQISQFTQKEKQIIQDLDHIDYTLNQARTKSDALSAEIRNLAQSIAAIQADRQNLTGRLQENKAYVKKRLFAFYRMRMIGSLDMMGMPASMFDFFVTENAMKQIVRSDFQILENQARDLDRLQTLGAQLAERKDAKDKMEQDLARQVRIIEQEARKKQGIRQEIQRKKSLSLAALASLQKSAKALDEKMHAFGEKKYIFEGESIFSRQKGQLAVPVTGKIVSRFGPRQSGDYKSFTFQSGIDIKVERGEPVRSVFKGEVLFAEWLKGYGNLVIINHGENYYTLYAHLQEVFKKKGETVETGEVIATAGDSGSLKGAGLHFELRHHGKPVDPLKWLQKGA
jgi:murein hydrolase activator